MMQLAVDAAVGWVVLVALFALSVSVFLFVYTLKMNPSQLTRQSKITLIGRKIGMAVLIAAVLGFCAVIGTALI